MTKRGSLKYYLELWTKAHLKDDPLSKKKLMLYSSKVIANIKRYQFIQKETGVPWQLVAAIHGLEASFNFNACLHNGDPLGKKTTHVPAGLGPFFTWESSAIDVLNRHHVDKIKHWSIPECLQFAEAFNGMGYLLKHTDVNSPYLWSMTNLYTKGKYVADGKYDPQAVSKQVGVAALFLDLKMQNLLDIPLV